MKIAYIDCFSGASGDMLLGALLGAGLNINSLQKELSKLNIKNWSITAKKTMRGSIQCTKFNVITTTKHCRHTKADEILTLIKKSGLANPIKQDAVSVFENLARAEAKIHNIKPAQVEFHEVGAVDSIIDIVGFSVARYLLGIEKIFHSKIPLSHNEIKTSHGTLPNPAPATLELLGGRTFYNLDIDKELITPTAAAILATLAEESVYLPQFKLGTVGYGAGDIDIDKRPNFLRILIGETPNKPNSDLVWVLETNLDNVSGEVIGFLCERLFEEGALDVFTTAIGMKKSRPGVKLSVIATSDKVQKIEKVIFEETPTLGIRKWLCERTKLSRQIKPIRTRWGTVRMKLASSNGAIVKAYPEYEDLRKIALAKRIPILKIAEAVSKAYNSNK